MLWSCNVKGCFLSALFFKGGGKMEWKVGGERGCCFCLLSVLNLAGGKRCFFFHALFNVQQAVYGLLSSALVPVQI